MTTNVALTLCAALAIMALPLALRLVGPNRVYGFRTKATLSDRDVWFSANAFAGWALFLAAIVGATLVTLRPAWFEFGVFTNLVAVFAPTVAAMFASSFYVRNR
jgi:uncharacterized membrane protein